MRSGFTQLHTTTIHGDELHRTTRRRCSNGRVVRGPERRPRHVVKRQLPHERGGRLQMNTCIERQRRETAAALSRDTWTLMRPFRGRQGGAASRRRHRGDLEVRKRSETDADSSRSCSQIIPSDHTTNFESVASAAEMGSSSAGWVRMTSSTKSLAFFRYSRTSWSSGHRVDGVSRSSQDISSTPVSKSTSNSSQRPFVRAPATRSLFTARACADEWPQNKTSSGGHESRRWREGASTRRDAANARLDVRNKTREDV